MRLRVALRVVTGALVLVLVAGTGAGAAKPYKVDSHGAGTFVLAADGAVDATGTAVGRPFDGTFVATLSAADGTLPAPGDCEPATATYRLTASRSRVADLAATGDVCGKWTDATFVVTHVFTGRYVATEESRRDLVGTEGFFSIRLALDGRASTLAIATT